MGCPRDALAVPREFQSPHSPRRCHPGASEPKTGAAGTEGGVEGCLLWLLLTVVPPAKGCLDMVTGIGTYSPASQANHWQILSRLKPIAGFQATLVKVSQH